MKVYLCIQTDAPMCGDELIVLKVLKSKEMAEKYCKDQEKLDGEFYSYYVDERDVEDYDMNTKVVLYYNCYISTQKLEPNDLVYYGKCTQQELDNLNEQQVKEKLAQVTAEELCNTDEVMRVYDEDLHIDKRTDWDKDNNEYTVIDVYSIKSLKDARDKAIELYTYHLAS